MGPLILVLDEVQTDAERDGAQAVQQCVQPRQKEPTSRIPAADGASEQPEQKGDSGPTQGQMIAKAARSLGFAVTGTIVPDRWTIRRGEQGRGISRWAAAKLRPARLT